jgi:GPH family glycoside/pentoside/hexuronide:cation symporter
MAGSARPGSLRLIAFSITALAIGGAGVPLAIYLPAFYAQTLHLDLGLVGTIFMVSRLWNAFSDPVVGALSDRTDSRFGRRKPWIAIGGLLFILSALFVFMPGRQVSPGQLMLSLFGLYLGWSMVSTPLYAWSGDLSGEYHQRTRVQTFMQTMAALGLALVLLIPTVLDWLGDPAPARKIALMGWFVILALSIGIPTLVLFFRENTVPQQDRPRASIAALWPVIANPLVLRVMGSDFFVALGQGFRSGLFVFFVSAYMGLPQWAGLLYLIQFIFGIFAAPIWMRIGYRLGKHRTVALGEVTQITVNLALLLLSPGQLAPLIALTVIQGLLPRIGQPDAARHRRRRGRRPSAGNRRGTLGLPVLDLQRDDERGDGTRAGHLLSHPLVAGLRPRRP